MAVTKTYLATEQSAWARAMPSKSDMFDQAATALHLPGYYAHDTTNWSSDLTIAPELVVVSGSAVPASNGIAWKFYSSGVADDTAEARLWGISKVIDGGSTEYMVEFLVELGLTVGTAVLIGSGESAILPDGKFMDTITIEEDHSLGPGARVVSNANNGVAVLVLDGFGYFGYILEMRRLTGSGGCGALYRTL